MDQLDRSSVVLVGEQMTYIEADMRTIQQLELHPTATICVDSLCFAESSDDILRNHYQNKGNRIFLFFSQYLFQPEESRERLKADHSGLAEALRRTGIPDTTVDYSANEYALYERSIQASIGVAESAARRFSRLAFRRFNWSTDWRFPKRT